LKGLFPKTNKKTRRNKMRKRQKLILIIYSIAVFIIGFIYVPYTRYYSGGIKTHAGHYFRPTFLYMTELPKGYVNIDAELIIAEIIALTAIFGAFYLIFKTDKTPVIKMQGPF
jgi:heme/copper-type cytochrome/quinol oxidase subunit 4